MTADEYKQQWREEYERIFVDFCVKNQYIEGGKFCAHARKKGLDEPDHHNAWGSMVSAMAKKGYIKKKGKVHPSTTHSHSEQLTLWESVLYKAASV